MAQNDEFLKVVAKNVTLQYPKLNQTYRYNTSEKRSEPCAQTASNAAWSVAFDMPKEQAKPLYDQLRDHYEKCRLSNTKLPQFKTVFGMKKLKDDYGNETGVIQFTAKRNGVKKNGELFSAPIVIDGQKQPLKDLNLWSGSKGSVRAWAFASIDPDGNGGISLLLDAVQVTDARYGDNGMDDFDTHSAPEPESDPFPTPKQASPQPQSQPYRSASMDDDEIPF